MLWQNYKNRNKQIKKVRKKILCKNLHKKWSAMIYFKFRSKLLRKIEDIRTPNLDKVLREKIFLWDLNEKQAHGFSTIQKLSLIWIKNSWLKNERNVLYELYGLYETQPFSRGQKLLLILIKITSKFEGIQKNPVPKLGKMTGV